MHRLQNIGMHLIVVVTMDPRRGQRAIILRLWGLSAEYLYSVRPAPYLFYLLHTEMPPVFSSLYKL